MPDRDTANPQTPSAGGRRVGGFEIVQRIGQGGMGTVYKARQESLDRIVALKILPSGLAKDADFIQRFIREARIAGKLSHPNVVAGIDVGEDDGCYYFAMEYINGESLSAVLKRAGSLPEDRVIQIARQVAEGMRHAHSHALIHRDIKPENILIDASGMAKICDLGLARSTDNEDSSLTQAGTSLGTPFYLSPEQASGEKNLDARTDIYALGATLFHLLAGQPLFDGPTPAVVMTKHLSESPRPLKEVAPQVSNGMAAVVAKCIEKRRDDRYASMAALIEDLDRVAAGEEPVAMSRRVRGVRDGRGRRSPTVSANPVAGTARSKEREPDTGERSPLALYALGGGGVILIGVLLFLFIGGERKDRPPIPSPGKEKAAPAVSPPVESATEKRVPPPENVARLLEAATDFWKTNPDDFAGAIAKFEKVRAAAGANEYRQKAEEAIAAIGKRRDEAVEAASRRLDDAANAFAAQGKYDPAIAVWEQLPPGLADVMRAQAVKTVGDLRTQAEARLKTALDEAERCVAGRRFAEGTKALDSIKDLVYRAGEERVAALRAKLTATETAEVDAARKATEATLAKYVKAFVDATLKGDVNVARKVAADAKADGALKDLAARTQELADVVGAIDRADAAQQAALEKLKDGRERTFELAKGGTLTGPVIKVVENELTVRTKNPGGGFAELNVRLMDMGEAERKRLAGDFKPATPAEQLAQGIRALLTEDFNAAGEALAAAKEHLLAPPYQARLDEKLLGAVEATAKSVWEAIRRDAGVGKLAEKAAKDIGDRVEVFEKEHGKTRFAAAIADEVATLKDRLAAVGGGKTLSLELGGGVKMEFVLAKAGEFEMGSTDGDPREQPVHKVKISKPFYVGKYHVTTAQFRRFVEVTKFETEAEKPPFPSVTFGGKDGKMEGVRGNWRSPGFKQDDNHPVVVVSWKDAKAFCEWASAMTKRTVRLPTEAEWEYAARGPQNLKYPWGDKWDSTLANHADASLKKAGFLPPKEGGLDPEDDGYAFTSPVGAYKNASWCGAYDMVGNVWQCCEDLLNAKYYAESPAVDPPGPAAGTPLPNGTTSTFHVLRGGSWLQPAAFCRGATRDPPNWHHTGCCAHYGFRVIVESVAPKTP